MYQVQVSDGSADSKASVGVFFLCRPCGNHFPYGGEPPMSNRVVALNSFVPPVRIVVSVMLQYRVVALKVCILTDYRLSFLWSLWKRKCLAPLRRFMKPFR